MSKDPQKEIEELRAKLSELTSDFLERNAEASTYCAENEKLKDLIWDAGERIADQKQAISGLASEIGRCYSFIESIDKKLCNFRLEAPGIKIR